MEIRDAGLTDPSGRRYRAAPALRELQRRAAARGDVRDAIREAELLAGSRRIAAADDGNRIGIRRACATAMVPFASVGFSNTPIGPFRHNGLGGLGGVGIQRHGLGTDVQALHVIGNLVGIHDLHIDRAVNGIGK